jgi:hypothetical protein
VYSKVESFTKNDTVTLHEWRETSVSDINTAPVLFVVLASASLFRNSATMSLCLLPSP